jgi:hypothetical protein
MSKKMDGKISSKYRFHSGWKLPVILLLVSCLFPPLCSGRLPSVSTLESRLAAQIRRMIQAGHLAPGVCFMEQHYAKDSERHGYELDDYWHNPGELIYTLAISIPYLTEPLRTEARSYLKSEFARYPPHTYVHMGPEGSLREIAARPPEYANGWAGFYDQRSKSATESAEWGSLRFPPFNIYACWKYAQIFPEEGPALLEKLRSKISDIPDPGQFELTHPHVLNGYIAGYYGYLNLQSLAGQTRSAEVEKWLAGALQRRLALLDQDPATLPGAEAGGFLLLVPELGDFLWKNARAKVEKTLEYQNWAAPYWHIARAEEITRVDGARVFWEGYHSHIYETASQFQARAYALKWPREKLEKYLDAPSVYRGDLTYIQNLVAALQAAPATAPPGDLRIIP